MNKGGGIGGYRGVFGEWQVLRNPTELCRGSVGGEPGKVDGIHGPRFGISS